MPSKKPNEERIKKVKTKFQAIESRVLESGKQRYFRLPYDAALEAIDADLSKTAYRLWIYLSANYPFSDREVDLPSQTELGIRLQVTRQSINIAAAELQAAGLWDFWPERWKGRNLRGYSPGAESGVKENRQVSKKSDTLSKKSDTRCQEKSTGCQKNLTPCQKNLTPDASELLPCKADKAPHTIQTYSDFIETLSDSERESFEKFVREEWKKQTAKNGQPGEEIVSMPRFLASVEDIKNWHGMFLNSAAGQKAKEEAIAAQFDWRNGPRFEDWIWKAFEGGYLWTQEDEAEREQRYAFYCWAQDTNAYEGVCYQ